MRTWTNLHIDIDALTFASSYANAKGICWALPSVN